MSDDKKKVRKPKPWYLGWGLAKFAASATDKHNKKTKAKIKEIQK